jgi:hypothetical protein
MPHPGGTPQLGSQVTEINGGTLAERAMAPIHTPGIVRHPIGAGTEV